MAFKGGTSLSKVYKAIDRFSEDIDVTVDYRSLVADAPELESITSNAFNIGNCFSVPPRYPGRFIQKIRGHTSVVMTQRYSHFSQDSLLRAPSLAGEIVAAQAQA
jgi:predicted nucleotidyltransferase component of viral defense system